MKIWQRFTLLMFVVVALFYLSEFFLLQAARDTLKNQIGQETLQMSRKTLRAVLIQLNAGLDQIRAFSRAIDLQSFARNSNEEFEKKTDLKSYIDRIDLDWLRKRETDEINSILQNNLSQAFRDYIEYYKDRYGFPFFNEIFATNRFGTVIGAYPRTSDYIQGDEEWFRKTVNSTEGLLQAVQFDESSGAFALDADLRIEDAEKKFLGALRVGINLMGIESMIESSRAHSAYKNIQVTLVDGKGMVLFDSSNENPLSAGSYPPSMSFGSNIASRDPVFRLIRGENGFLEYERDGVRYLSAYTRSPEKVALMGLDWGLVVDIELEEVFTPVSGLEKGFFLTMLCSLLILALMGSQLIFSIIRPLYKLRAASVQLAEGQFEKNLDVDRKDEIGELARSFSLMAKKIFNQKRFLEQRVEERTRELSVAKDAAESASRAKSEFLARMSHELRTPLNGILGFAQILNMEMESPLSRDQKESVDKIYKSGTHLLELINEVLDLSRVESGNLQMELEEVELCPIVEEAVSVSEPLGLKKAVQINFRDKGDPGIHVRADALRLKQVSLNLLSNAILYNRKGGSVDIFIKDKGDGTIRLSFRDTGEGIPQEKLGRLFKPFERLEEDQDATEGTGIGLTISRQFIEMMGGKIGVESQYGVGSCFYIELPRA